MLDRRWAVYAAGWCMILAAGTGAGADPIAKKPRKPRGEIAMSMTLTSAAFKENAAIPSKYTCDAEDMSPPLAWSGAPKDAKSYALISDDPDAPAGTWVHWVLWNLPADTTVLPENLPKTETLPNGASQGLTDFRTVGYGGPCPPSGTHRYFFKLYALDTILTLPAKSTKAQLESAMKGRILAQARLIGLYSRSR